jgi:hypothetical protein
MRVTIPRACIGGLWPTLLVELGDCVPRAVKAMSFGRNAPAV